MKYRVTPSSSASAHSAVCPNQNLPILSSSFRAPASWPSECPPLSLTSLNTHATLMVSEEVTISPLWGVPGSRTLASPTLYISYRSTSRISNKPGQDQYLPQQCEEYHLAPLLFFRHQELHHSQTITGGYREKVMFYHYQELHHPQTKSKCAHESAAFYHYQELHHSQTDEMEERRMRTFYHYQELHHSQTMRIN